MSADRKRAWYEIAFGAVYPLVYGHRDEAAAEREAEYALAELALGSGAAVLDLACGTGRHQRALAARGVIAVGLDLSPELLRANAGRGGRRLVRGDMRRLPFATGAFDAVLVFFTSFGYFPDEAEDRVALAELTRVLAPGGRVLLDYLDSGTVRRELVPRSERQQGDLRVLEERAIADGRIRKQVRVLDPAGAELASYEESVRLYSADELRSMMEAAGLGVATVHGGFDRRPPGQGSRVVMIAEKRSAH